MIDEKLRKYDMDIDASQIYTSAYVTAKHLAKEIQKEHKVYVVGERGLKMQLQ